MHATSLTSGVLLMWETFETHGLDSRKLFEKAGLNPAKLRNPDARYPDKKIMKLWEYALEAIDDPCLGLEVASYFHPTTLHALGFAWLASQSLKDAFARLIRYSRIITDVEKLSFEETTEDYRFKIHLPDGRHYFPYEDYDAAFAIVVKLCRLSCGDDFSPKHMVMQRQEPACVDKFYAFFRCSIDFAAESYEIWFNKQDIVKQLPAANERLALMNDKVVMDYLVELDKDDIVMQVKQKLIDRLPTGKVTQKDIANAVHMSERSLQRKLADRKTSYKKVLDEVRSELAKGYINDARLSLNEITYLLGFSEPANFTRAFKRWHGVAPSAYRVSA